ncbi:exopolysaccharide biosynthesis UDP-galactose-lipid carrier transferase [Paracoccus sp. S-4012]|uniref:sugar transferase n=1 Tax=Paracoccus sp. S-4012 TaxID=2665648 RepID=UPI0012AFF354|nr:sugar transferase [Paracoccus sp. S-4012]MRX51814.1 exopolysaccharide biosynthesis UDP-galactose-lipid carrier transferase [Paracoccus sp. S-4012]
MELLRPEATGFGGSHFQSVHSAVPDAASGAVARPDGSAWSAAAAPLALLAGDAGTFAIAASLLAPFGSFAGDMPALSALVAAAVLLLYWSDGLYPGYGIYPHELLRRRFAAAGKVALLTGAGAMLLTGSWRMAALSLSLLAIALVLQPAARALVRSALARAGLWGKPVTVLGDAVEADALRDYLATNWQIGMTCKGPGREGGGQTALVLGLQTPADGFDISGRFTEVIAVEGLPGAPGLRPDFGGGIGLRLRGRAKAAPGWAGRAMDLVVAGLALLLVGPILLLAAAAIYLTDPGPVIYRQTREGLGGRPFSMLKLRTMYRDAEQRLERLLQEDEAARAEWSTHFKLRNDPRVLPVIGAFLRASSIDELPQLLNVIRGEMRTVGPRPFPAYHLAAMDPEFRAKRCTVTPGVTGLWQISGRSNADISRQQALDGFYIDNRSFWFDAHILLGTFAAVFRGHGAY